MGNNQVVYNEVPNIISYKDLNYLSDMFNCNYLAYKCINDSIKSISLQEIKELFINASELFYSNMNNILSILEGGNNE